MTYKIVIDAAPQKGHSVAEVRRNLNRLFKRPLDDTRILSSGKPITVKRGLELDQAQVYLRKILTTGAQCSIVADDDPQKTKKTVADSCTTTQCPHCNYMTRNPEDPLITGAGGMGECPQCGIIVKKYRNEGQSEASPPLPDIPPLTSSQTHKADKKEPLAEQINTPPENNHLPATTRRRALAGLYTFLCGVILFLVLYLPVFTLMSWSLNSEIKNAPADNIARIAIKGSKNIKVTRNLLILVTTFYLLVVVPSNKGQTWGQMQMAVWPVDELGKKAKNGKVIWIRFGVQLFTFLTLGLPLLAFYLSKDRKTLAERLSGTTLVEDPEAYPVFGKAVCVIAIGMWLVSIFSATGLNNWIEATIQSHIKSANAPRKQSRTMQTNQLNRTMTEEKMMIRVLMDRCQEGDIEACEALPGGPSQR